MNTKRDIVRVAQPADEVSGDDLIIYVPLGPVIILPSTPLARSH